MKKKLLTLLMLMVVFCLAVGIFAACNQDNPDDSKVDFKPGDSVSDNKDVEYTISPDGSSYTFTGKLYTVNYLVKDDSHSYVILNGEKPNELSITGFKGEITSLSIQDIERDVKINKKPISINAIADNAFSDCASLVSVDLTKTNMSLAFTIGKNAFSRCTSLKNVVLPDNVYTVGNIIGDYAFSFCSALTTATITGNFNDLGAYAFYGCTALKGITLPDSIKVIKEGTFAKCSSLQSFDGCNNLQSIQTSAFAETALAEFDFAKYTKLVHIGDRAFYSTELTSVTIPQNVTYVGTKAFYNIRPLQSVNLAYLGNTMSAGNWQFANEFGLASEKFLAERKVTVSIGVCSQIPDRAFADCVDIKNIEINSFAEEDTYPVYGDDGISFNSVEVVVSPEMGAMAFAGCTNLESVKLPDEVSSISNFAFRECSSLTSFDVGNNVETIGDFAFRDCTSLTNVTLGTKVTDIGNSAFLRCDNLTSITFNNNLQKIGSNAFERTGLTSITLSENVKTIGTEAFTKSKLTSVTLNENLEEISSRAFFGCRQLQSLTLPAGTTKLGSAILGDCSALETLVVNGYNYTADTVIGSGDQAITVTTFQSKSLTDLFATNTELSDTYMYAAKYGEGTYAYAYLPKTLANVTLSHVDQVDDNALRGWTSLQNVTLEFVETAINVASTTYPIGICDYAFYDCKNLETLTLVNGDKAVAIGSHAFENCSKFAASELAKFSGLEEIQTRAFANSGMADIVTLPASLQALGTEIFYECENITSLVFEDYDKTWNTNYEAGFNTYNGTVAALFGANTITNSETFIEQNYVSVTPNSLYGSSYLIPKKLKSVSLLNTNKLSQYALTNMSGLTSVTIEGTEQNPSTGVENTSLRGLASLTTLNYVIPTAYYMNVTEYGILNGATKLENISVALPKDGAQTTSYWYLANLFVTGGTSSSNNSLPATLQKVSLVANDASYIPSRLLYNAVNVNEVEFVNGENIKEILADALTGTSLARTVNVLTIVTPAENETSQPTTTKYTTYTYNNWVLSTIGNNGAYYLPADVVGVANGIMKNFDILYTAKTTEELQDVKSLVIANSESVKPIETDWQIESKIEQAQSKPFIRLENDSLYPFTAEESNGVISLTSTNKQDNSSSTCKLFANKSCAVSFDYRTSTEANYDKLTIRQRNADGDLLNTIVNGISGTNSDSGMCQLSQGDYLEITYSKDGSSSGGSDEVYITIAYPVE